MEQAEAAAAKAKADAEVRLVSNWWLYRLLFYLKRFCRMSNVSEWLCAMFHKSLQGPGAESVCTSC